MSKSAVFHSKNLTADGGMPRDGAISALRRDATFLWNAVIVFVFVSFAGLAVASAVLDLVSVR